MDGREKTFTAGVSDWKNISMLIKRHTSEACHINASARSECYGDIQLGKSESINKSLSDSSKVCVNRNRHILTRIVEVIVLLSKQNIPFRGHTEINSNFFAILNAFAQTDDVLAEHLANAHYNAKYTSPDVQNELINVCANQLKEQLLSDCRKCPFFAIMADEATDKSTKEQLSMCVRFVDENCNVREEFLGFVECTSIKGAALCENILAFLQEADLDVLKIRAQCYDGASNMSGKFRGLQALVRERSPHANYVHCKSHCLNLALVHSSNIPCVRTMMSTVQDISFMFDYSAKRLVAFQNELSQDIATKEEMAHRTKLRTLCETRWSSRADALGTFKHAFPVVVHALETLQEDRDEKAGLYLAAILRFEFIIALVVAEHILSSTVPLTNLLQKEDNDLLHAVEETRVIIKLCNDERGDEDVWNALYDQATAMSAEFDILPSKPRQVGRQRHRANPDVQTVSAYYRITLYNVFLDHLTQEMETRILGNESRYSAQYLLPSKLPDLQDASLPSIYAAYAPDMQHSFEEFKTETVRWKVRWSMTDIRPSRLQDTLNQTNKDLYPCIYTILGVLLTMPPTSASCERSFSGMKRIKNYLRSTMRSDRLSSLALIHIHKDMDIDIERVINVFASVKCRKLEFF